MTGGRIAALDALDGGRVPGGCSSCDAYQVVDATAAPVYRVTVHHDDWCPVLRRLAAGRPLSSTRPHAHPSPKEGTAP